MAEAGGELQNMAESDDEEDIWFEPMHLMMTTGGTISSEMWRTLGNIAQGTNAIVYKSA